MKTIKLKRKDGELISINAIYPTNYYRKELEKITGLKYAPKTTKSYHQTVGMIIAFVCKGGWGNDDYLMEIHFEAQIVLGMDLAQHLNSHGMKAMLCKSVNGTFMVYLPDENAIIILEKVLYNIAHNQNWDYSRAIEEIEPILGVSKFAKEVCKMNRKTDKAQSANNKVAVDTPTKAKVEAQLKHALDGEEYERAAELRDLLNKP